MSSPVTAPSHYNQGDVECIDAIQASMSKKEFAGYLKGNAFKYLWRYRLKGKALEDLKKSQWYLNKLIEMGVEEEAKRVEGEKAKSETNFWTKKWQRMPGHGAYCTCNNCRSRFY